jgi:diguanylate cyclase
MIVAESIRKSIASKELKRKTTGENFGVITVSIGVAVFRENEDSPITLIARADDALYRSKHAGRNRVTQENLSA